MFSKWKLEQLERKQHLSNLYNSLIEFIKKDRLTKRYIELNSSDDITLFPNSIN